jgi:hypothetical protein
VLGRELGLDGETLSRLAADGVIGVPEAVAAG